MTNATSIEDGQLTHILADARSKLRGANGRLVLDFSPVRRIDVRGIHELETLAMLAEENEVKMVLRGVNVELYAVLKAVRLAPRFAFAA